MTQFTEGPWNVCGKGDCSCKAVWCADHPIAEVTHGDWGDDYPSIRLVGPSLMLQAEAYMKQITYGHISDELAKANALLIASAPDLFHALNGLLGLFALVGSRPDIPDDIKKDMRESHRIADAVAALAKARGESPPAATEGETHE